MARNLIKSLNEHVLTTHIPLVRWVTAHDNYDAMRLYDKVATQTQWKIYDIVVKPFEIYPAFMDGKL